MNLHYECMACQLREELALIEKLSDNESKVAFLKDVCKTISEADTRYAGPALTPSLDAVNSRFGFERPDYAPLKKQYNDLMLSLLPELAGKVRAAADPLAEAIKISRAGNYIDFGAFRAIDDERLNALLQRAQEEALDEAEYACLLEDLARCNTLTYVTDNCGEVVLDKLVLEQLRRRFAQLQITVMARGAAVLNDATVEDILYAGLDEYAQVMGNGASLAGCQMELISPQARRQLEKSDVIIAKGMGNFETLCECGLNVYYLFLCKCDYFSRRLKVPLMTGVLANERRLNAWKRGQF